MPSRALMPTPIALPDREIVHDLRNLFSVLASAGHLLEDAPNEHRRVQLLVAIEVAAMRGSQLTTALLGRDRPADAKPVDLRKSLAAVEPMIQALAGRAQVRFDLGGRSLPALLDASELEAAVLELVANARSVLSARSTLHIRAQRVGDQIWVIVADDGDGMSPERLEQVLRDPVAPAAKGSGLRRVRSFVRACHGNFHVRNRAGHGTVVAMTLPMVAAIDQPAAAERYPPTLEEIDHEDRQPIAA
ncbi:MAG: HAMP domain-containing sensor histidine kinase [Sphingomonas bacterium]